MPHLIQELDKQNESITFWKYSTRRLGVVDALVEEHVGTVRLLDAQVKELICHLQQKYKQ